MTTPSSDPAGTPASDSAPAAAGQGAAGVTVPGPVPIDLGGQQSGTGTTTGDGPAPAPDPTPGSGATKTARAYARDLVERVVATFLQAFLGGLVVTAPLDLATWKTAVVAGIAAVLALLKGLVARLQDDRNSASLAEGI